MNDSPRRRAHNLALAAMAEAAGLPGARVESVRQGCYSDAEVRHFVHEARGESEVGCWWCDKEATDARYGRDA